MMKRRLIAVIPLLLALTACKEQELLKGLDQNQANEVVSLLQRNNIQADKREISKEGYIVSVDRGDFVAAVDLINTYNLPAKPDMEVAQMFPADSLVSSPRAEKARLYSGIEQRLEQSLRYLQGVVSARVHVSYDLSADESSSKKRPMHISTLLTYDNRVKDTTLLISDAKRFIVNSFDNVDYANISVVLSEVAAVQRVAPQVDERQQDNLPLWLLAALAAVLSVGGLLGVFFLRKHDKPLAQYLKPITDRKERLKAAGRQISATPDKASHDAASNA